MNGVLSTTMDVQVWVGCLGCYNEGKLVGEWMDATDAGDYKCPEPVTIYNIHEELWVMDHEIPGVNGEMDPMTAVKWGEAFGRVPDYHEEAFRAWLSIADVSAPDWDLYDRFIDAYMGEHESIEDFAWYMLEETRGEVEAPPGFMLTVDTVAWEQDYTYVDGFIFNDHA